MALGIWLKAKCGADVNDRAARARDVYDLPPRREAARLSGVDLDAGAGAAGAHRLNLPKPPPDKPIESWIERPGRRARQARLRSGTAPASSAAGLRRHGRGPGQMAPVHAVRLRVVGLRWTRPAEGSGVSWRLAGLAGLVFDPPTRSPIDIA